MTHRAKVSPWYGSARWKARRAAQLGQHPFCAMCAAIGARTPATVADHVTPHKGDPKLFWHGALQSLCSYHHNSTKARIENGREVKRFGLDGWPI